MNSRPLLPAHPRTGLLFGCLLFLLALIPAQAEETEYIQGTGLDGEERQLDVSRYPALYTGDFDDCLPDNDKSLFNITKFDAAYYADNRTVAFRLDGTSNIEGDNVISE